MMAVCGVVFVDLLQLSFIFPLLPSIAQAFGASTWGIGLLSTGTAVGEAVASPVLGSIADRMGRKPVLLWATMGSTLAAIGTACSGNYWLLLTARLAQGICGGTVGVVQAYIADVTVFEERSEYMSHMMVGLMAGLALGPVCGGYLSVWLGWRGAVAAASVLSLLNFAMVLFLVVESKQLDKSDVEKPAPDALPDKTPKFLARQTTGVTGAMDGCIASAALANWGGERLQRRRSMDSSLGTSLPPMLSPEMKADLLKRASTLPSGTTAEGFLGKAKTAQDNQGEGKAAEAAPAPTPASEPVQRKSGALSLGWPAWLLCFTSFLFTMGQPGLMTIGVLFISEQYTDGDIDAATLAFANLFTLVGVSGICWNILLFRTLKRLMGDVGLIIAGGTVRALGWVFCAYAPTVWSFNGGVIAFSLGGNCMFPVVQSILTEIVPAENTGSAIGIGQLFQNLARALGPIFMVPLYDTNARLPFLATAAAGFLIVVLVLVARHFGLKAKSTDTVTTK